MIQELLNNLHSNKLRLKVTRLSRRTAETQNLHSNKLRLKVAVIKFVVDTAKIYIPIS